MPYQYVREPLTVEESDRLSKACETPAERLAVRTLLDTGLPVGELCDLTRKNVLWQQRQLRFKGKGGPRGKTSRFDGCTVHRCLWVRTGSGIREARPHPRALPPPRTTWAKSATHVYSVLQSKWLLRAPSAL